MEYVFRDHAEYRMKKRGLLKEEVIEAIEHSDKTFKKHGKYYAQKNIGRGAIEVYHERTERYIRIITIYWL